MREILFRGKLKCDGEWVEGYYLKKEENKHYMVDKQEPFYSTPYFYEVIPETVGQFTGLTDKNGKKIFEGDILHVISETCNYEFKTKVGEMYGYKSGFYVDGEFDVGDFTEIGFAFDYWQNDEAEIEIIGNIHDNPELLE